MVKNEQQSSTSSQKQTDKTTEPKWSSSDGHNRDIISTNDVRENYLFLFFSVLSNLNSRLELTLLNLFCDFCLLDSTFLKVLSLMAVNLSRYSLTRHRKDTR